MSLFGDSDAPGMAAAQTKSSLFDDGPATPSKGVGSNNHNTTITNNSSSLFADSSVSAEAESSPWGFTPRKTTGRGNLVKSLLADADVPDLYIDTFDNVQSAGEARAPDWQRLLQDSGVSGASQSKIRSILGGDQALRRAEFNVLLALIGLAQEGEELSLDAVDERRNQLPLPALQTDMRNRPVTPQNHLTQTTEAHSSSMTTTTQNQSSMLKNTFGVGFGDNDPWASPAAPKDARMNGSGVPQRTTSGFTTNGTEPSNDGTPGSFGSGAQTSGSGGGVGSWGDSGAGEGFGNTGGLSGGPSGAGGNGGSGLPQRPQHPRIEVGKGVEEVVTVNLLDEKEGMFMFQHRNYEVASVRRNSKVIRRYSDFVWLLDCLHKRYPFRQLPLLPPKRVAINGNHIAADALFLEKRRRGLARFANALVRHPVLREEQLVVMFMTVPTELAVWRKQATLNVQEEFVGKALPPALEESLSPNLLDTFDTVRSGIRRSTDIYINLCGVVERLCKRKEAIAAEYSRMNLNLTTLTETSNETYAMDQNDVPLLNEGIKGTAKHIDTSQALLEDEARAWDGGFLEDVKTMRDILVSMRDMFDRRDRFARDNIPQLERRIQQNEQRLQTIKAKGGAAKPGEAEKVETAIANDKQSIVDQHARGVFIKECIRDELLYFQTSQYRVSRLHQDWAQERVKYAELQADNFRGMVDAVESMPQGD